MLIYFTINHFFFYFQEKGAETEPILNQTDNNDNSTVTCNIWIKFLNFKLKFILNLKLNFKVFV